MSQSTSISSSCPTCGAPLDAGSGGVCPRCLMLAAMAPTSSTGEDLRQPPPALGVVQAAFPQLEILELIGQGGMGCVFKARQPKLNRLVALKLLPASFAGRDAAFAGRFEREGQLLARLHHPNIVAVHDSGATGDFFYLVMEFVDGVNLRQAMRSQRFTPAQALAIVPHICDALQFAHDEGVLHRDIKPENILLDGKGRVKLADFGIAKLLAESEPAVAAAAAGSTGLTESGALLGTPSYMAPEQRDAPNDVDNRADIYSLGVVFYELLTGELPPERFAPPSGKGDADPRLDAIVQQALEKERSRRQRSASEMKTQVEDLRVPAAPAAPSWMLSFAAQPRAVRRRWLAFLLTGALLGTLLFCGCERRLLGQQLGLGRWAAYAPGAAQDWTEQWRYGLVGEPWLIDETIHRARGGRNTAQRLNTASASFAAGLLAATAWALVLLGVCAEARVRLPAGERVFWWTVFAAADGDRMRVRWPRLLAALGVAAAAMCVLQCFVAVAMHRLLGAAPAPLLLMVLTTPMTLGPMLALLGKASGVSLAPRTPEQKRRVFTRLALVFAAAALLLLAFMFTMLKMREDPPPPPVLTEQR